MEHDGPTDGTTKARARVAVLTGNQVGKFLEEDVLADGQGRELPGLLFVARVVGAEATDVEGMSVLPHLAPGRGRRARRGARRRGVVQFAEKAALPRGLVVRHLEGRPAAVEHLRRRGRRVDVEQVLVPQVEPVDQDLVLVLRQQADRACVSTSIIESVITCCAVDENTYPTQRSVQI